MLVRFGLVIKYCIRTYNYFLFQECIYMTAFSQVQMMQNVHLAPDTDEDDLYSGYNDYNPTYDTEVRTVIRMHTHEQTGIHTALVN